jgi:hypothetical protein
MNMDGSLTTEFEPPNDVLYRLQIHLTFIKKMKNVRLIAIIGILSFLSSCGQKTHEHEHSPEAVVHEGGNQALYNEVMKVHDEVMPKMNDIYKLREQLKKRLADTPDMIADKKKEMESTILKLDAASDEMMVWMRNFNPIPDSLGEANAREYLQEEKVKVNKVKADMLKAIEDAEAIK